MSKVTQTLRHTFDICLFLALCFVEVAINLWMKPFRRGFFCGDESLQYPYQPETIGLPIFLAISLGIPALVILAVELFKQRHVASALDKSHSSSTCCHLGQRLRHCYTQLGYYLFGYAMMIVATEISKYSLGRLRPNFYSVCQPQLPDGSTCEDPVNHGRFIEEYTCRGDNSSDYAVNQISKAFPSAHTSASFYAMLYISIYLQAMLSTCASKLLKHLLQFVFMMLAWYVSLSRISDYWHHWSDVLAGMALGSVFAVLVAFFIADLFGRRRCSRAQPQTTGSNSSSAQSATPVLPAYTFGNVPYLPHHHHVPHHHQYGQTYHNYGYVP